MTAREQLRQARIEAGLTQQGLSIMAGMHPNQVYRYESGNRGIPAEAFVTMLEICIQHTQCRQEGCAEPRYGCNDLCRQHLKESL